jgi:ferrous iron transport protein A
LKSTIKDLQKGQNAVVKQYFDLQATCKLMTMGLVPNAKVEFIRKGPFGGAYYVKVDGHIIGMRENEASSVEIEIYE